MPPSYTIRCHTTQQIYFVAQRTPSFTTRCYTTQQNYFVVQRTPSYTTRCYTTQQIYFVAQRTPSFTTRFDACIRSRTGFPAKWRVRNEQRNSILMTRYYPDLDSASDWLKQISHAARPIKNTTQIWVVTAASSVSKFCASFWNVISVVSIE